MSPLSQHALEMQQSPSRWEYALEALLIALLGFCPFAFGARDDWSQQAVLGLAAAWSPEIVLILAAAMAAVLAARQVFQRGVRFVWTWAYLPIVLFLLICLFQLLPLPANVIGALSPQTLKLKTELLGDLPDGPKLLHALTPSFYPLATRHDLWMLMSVVTVFVVVLNVYRRSTQIKRLLLAVSIIGFAEVLIAVYQNAFGVRTIYGGVPAIHPNSGTFLNHNAFSQFVNLSIGAMLALLLVKVREITEGSHTFGDSFQLLKYAKLNSVYALATAILISAATVFLSASRAGMISTVFAGALTGVLLIWRRGKSTASSILMLFAIGALVVAFLVASGTVFERLSTLRNAAQDNGDRGHVLEYISHEARQFPLLGTGLGTHRYIYPMYDQSVIYSMSYYAENEYAQLVEEAGAVGAALCLVFVLIIAASYFRTAWKPRRPVHVAAYGLGFGLLAILIQSATDFGQHDAANACLTATFSALLIVLARHARPMAEAHRSKLRHRSSATKALQLAGAVAVVCLFALPLGSADAARRARVKWAQAESVKEFLDEKGWERGTDSNFAALLVSAADASKIEPQDVFMGYWLNVFRWRSFDRYRDAHTGALQRTEITTRSAARIVDELNTLRASCPTFGAPYCLAGRLEYFFLDRASGPRDIRIGYRLDHNDPDACLAAAELDAAEKNWADSLTEARRALELDSRSVLDAVLPIYVQRDRPDLAYELVQDDLDGLGSLADMLKDSRDQQLAVRCRKRLRELKLIKVKSPDASPFLLADVAHLYDAEGNDQEAVNYYEQALAKRYAEVEWRLRLAQLLAKSGNTTGAEKEARACLRLQPNMPEAVKLLNSLTALEAEGGNTTTRPAETQPTTRPAEAQSDQAKSSKPPAGAGSGG